MTQVAESPIEVVNPEGGPKVSPAAIQADMQKIDWQAGRYGDTTSTFVHAFLNGFYLGSGHSACISAENFDEAKGKEIALSNAFTTVENKLWELHGYYLRRSLDEGRVVLAGPSLDLPPHEQRLLIEFGELNNRCTKLAAFSQTPAFDELPQEDQELLAKQSNIMFDLHEVLAQRVERITNKG